MTREDKRVPTNLTEPSEPLNVKNVQRTTNAVGEVIFKSNPKKYARLAAWIKAAEKKHRSEVVVTALVDFTPYAPKVDAWWPYLDKILDRTEKDMSFAEHEAEHNRRKEELKKPDPNLSLTDLVKLVGHKGN
jgi:hypothetical protein